MPSTYTPIASTTLSAVTTDITFSSVPATYTDIVVVLNYKAVGSKYCALRFNGDTSSNYSRVEVNGNGAFVQTNGLNNETYAYISSMYATDGNIGTAIMNIQNYANTNMFKSVVSTAYSQSTSASYCVNTWRSTSAISTILVTSLGPSFGIGTVVSLYGIKAA